MIAEDILTDLQIRLAFQEDAIATLDRQVHDQQRQIEVLEQRCRLLLDRMSELLADPGDSGPEPPPPHY